MTFETQSMVHVRFELEDGLHMYGRPLPDNYIASEVTIPDTPGLRVGTAQYPPTHPREFAALGVTLNVYAGVVDVAIPVTPNAEVFHRSNGGAPALQPASARRSGRRVFNFSKIPSMTLLLPANNASGPPACTLLNGAS